jgi:hypothetical protein
VQGGAKRAFAGMPYIITIATGVGRIAFSRDATGELVVMPLPQATELDVREHAFLLASHTVSYTYVRIQGLRNILHGGQGMYMDRFVTTQWPGLVTCTGTATCSSGCSLPARASWSNRGHSCTRTSLSPWTSSSRMCRPAPSAATACTWLA